MQPSTMFHSNRSCCMLVDHDQMLPPEGLYMGYTANGTYAGYPKVLEYMGENTSCPVPCFRTLTINEVDQKSGQPIPNSTVGSWSYDPRSK